MWRWVTRGLVVICLFGSMLPALQAQTFVGGIDSPADTSTVSGLVLVRGWALDQTLISRVDLYIDDQFQYPADINLPRVDIQEAFPNWPGIQNINPGFIIGFATARFTDGPHTLSMIVTSSANVTSEIGRRTIVVDNSINQPPLAVVDQPGSDGTYDVSGSFPVAGWAADYDGVKEVDVLVDGLTVQSAVYGDARPDVGNTFPDVPTAQYSGFVANVDSTQFTDGVHTMTLRATDALNFSRIFGQRTIQIFNTEGNLRPFGFIDEPLRDATIYGNCNAELPSCQVSPCPVFNPMDHITPVRGWTLDLGTATDPGRVAYAQMMLDGVPWASTDDCAFSNDFNAYVNCYGLERFDVQRYYPTYPDAPRSGFFFALDAGLLMNQFGIMPGNHTLKVRVGDLEQTFADLPDAGGINVFFACSNMDHDFSSFGYIDVPNNMDFIKGTVTWRGWALDEDVGGVKTVQIYVDGNHMGQALYGSFREDVHAAYPTVFHSDLSGWEFTIDTTQLSDAKHRLTVQANDLAGHAIIIGSRDFVVDNPD